MDIKLIRYAPRILSANHEGLLQIVEDLAEEYPDLNVASDADSKAKVDVLQKVDGTLILLARSSDLVDFSEPESTVAIQVLCMLNGRDKLLMQVASWLVAKHASYLSAVSDVITPSTIQELSIELGIHRSSVQALCVCVLETPKRTLPLRELFVGFDAVTSAESVEA